MPKPTNDLAPKPFDAFTPMMVRVAEREAAENERLKMENTQLRAEVMSLQAALRRLEGR